MWRACYLLGNGMWPFVGWGSLKTRGLGGRDQSGVRGQVTEVELGAEEQRELYGLSSVPMCCFFFSFFLWENQKGAICLLGKGHAWWLVTSGVGSSSLCHPEYQSSLGVGNQGRKKGLKKKRERALLPIGQLSVCCLQAAATHSLQLKWSVRQRLSSLCGPYVSELILSGLFCSGKR